MEMTGGPQVPGGKADVFHREKKADPIAGVLQTLNGVVKRVQEWVQPQPCALDTLTPLRTRISP